MSAGGAFDGAAGAGEGDKTGVSHYSNDAALMLFDCGVEQGLMTARETDRGLLVLVENCLEPVDVGVKNSGEFFTVHADDKCVQ